MNGKTLEKLISLLKVYIKIVPFISNLFLNAVNNARYNTHAQLYFDTKCISPLFFFFCIQGDNNFGDDRLLYAQGQLWLQQHHIMGRAVGLVHILYKSCLSLTNDELINIKY